MLASWNIIWGKNLKIVVTGALGHIGSRLIRELPVKLPGSRIVMVDNLSTQRYCSLFGLVGDSYEFVDADVLEADLPSIFGGVQTIVHLAALVDPTASFANPEQVEHVNYNMTAKVADACLREGCSLFHVSSCSVYGSQSDVFDEDFPVADLVPQSPYAATKLKEEQYLRELDGLRYSICRFGTICGVSPGMRFQTAVNKFCWQAAVGKPLTVWQTAMHQKRPYLTLHDAVNAISFFIARDLFDGGVYNVLSDNLTVSDIIGFIARHVPDLDITYVETAAMNDLSFVVSRQRVEELGFEFGGSVENSITETLRLLNSTTEGDRPGPR